MIAEISLRTGDGKSSWRKMCHIHRLHHPEIVDPSILAVMALLAVCLRRVKSVGAWYMSIKRNRAINHR